MDSATVSNKEVARYRFKLRCLDLQWWLRYLSLVECEHVVAGMSVQGLLGSAHNQHCRLALATIAKHVSGRRDTVDTKIEYCRSYGSCGNIVFTRMEYIYWRSFICTGVRRMDGT